MDTLIYGADSETLRGKPMTFQFFSPMARVELGIEVDEKSAQKKFFAWCKSLRRHYQHVVYVHNLEFDLPEFLYDSLEYLALGDFDFSVGDWNVSGVYGGPNFARIRSKGRDILIVDSYSYFHGSLEQAAKLFCPKLEKLPRPPQLGSKKYTFKDSRFAAYAMRDAEIAYHIGVSIEETVREYDIPQPVSVASLASNIFRRHFVKETIHQPHRDIVRAALASYHGGKNGWIGTPGWFEDVVSIDLKSAYPKAGSLLPAFSNPDLFREVRVSPRAKQVPTCGVYLLEGAEVKDCHYPVAFDHGFKPLSGRVEHVWVQGWELCEGLRTGEIKLRGITRGYIYDEDRDPVDSPFAAYFEHFYKLKESEPNKIQREKNKFILNSVTGKLIETRKGNMGASIDADTGEVFSASDLVAGSLFHPFSASFITAHTRAHVHQLEHEIGAIHTATDGLFAPRSVKTKRFKETKELGAPSFECAGDLMMLRNKVYVLYEKRGAKPSEKSFPSPCFEGRRVIKYAKHGFQGTLKDLERIVITGDRSYTVNTPNKLKSSLNKGLQVNDFVTSTRKLNI